MMILSTAPICAAVSIALHRRTGVYTAALIADYMIARALEWTRRAYDEDSEDEQRLSHELAALASQLCLGEYRQMRYAFDFDITLRSMWQRRDRRRPC